LLGAVEVEVVNYRGGAGLSEAVAWRCLEQLVAGRSVVASVAGRSVVASVAVHPVESPMQ
jgi:hypothetical protein